MELEVDFFELLILTCILDLVATFFVLDAHLCSGIGGRFSRSINEIEAKQGGDGRCAK